MSPLSIGHVRPSGVHSRGRHCKPGNVSLADHIGLYTSFADPTASDFLPQCGSIAPILESAPLRDRRNNSRLHSAKPAKVTSTNTNLGIVLLLAPLASVPPHRDLQGGLMRGALSATT